MPFIRWVALESMLASLGLHFHFCNMWGDMLNDSESPRSSTFLILCLLVYFFNVSWINQKENLAEKQGCYLYHYIIFASSPALFLLFKLKTLVLLLIFASYMLYGQTVIILICKHLESAFQVLPIIFASVILIITTAQAGRYYLQFTW